MNNTRKLLGIRLSALLETILGIGLLVLIDQFFAAGNMFWDINPHPFWVVVIFVAVQYGTAEALFAAAIATLAYLMGGWPERIEGQDVFAFYYDLLIMPILWFAVGACAGEFTLRHLRKVVHLDEALDESQTREQTISESYHFVKGRKEDLETQLAGRLTSSVQAYRAAKAIESLNPKELLRGVEDLVSAVLNPQKFSLYLVENNSLSATIMHGWNSGDNVKQSYDSFDSLYQQVVAQQQMLCIANADQEAVLSGQGILAGPVMDAERKRVIGMLKIEQMEFVSLGLSSIETFKALCEWIGASMTNAEQFQTVKQESVINPEHNLMTYHFFKRQSDYLAKLAKRVGFDLSMVVVRLNDAEKMSDTDRLSMARQLCESVRGALRNIDLAFEYQINGDEFSILLPATSKQGASVVRDKISKALEKQLRQLGENHFSYIVQSLHEAK